MESEANVLVTGGSGFVGSYIVNELLSRWPIKKIIILDDYSSGSTARHVNDPRVAYVVAQTQQIEERVGDRLGKFTHVFHLGEFSRIVPSFEKLTTCFASNFDGTWRTLEFARRHRAKLIYAASSSIFGNGGADAHLSPYAFSKSTNCQLIRNYGSWFDLDYAITYFFNVYGPGHVRRGTYSTAIGIFEEQVLSNEPLTVVAPGTQIRDFTHVKDVARGMVLAAEKGHGDGYMLGAGDPKPIIEVAEMFRRPYVIVPERRGERLTGCADSTKAREELGWQPEHRLSDHVDAFLNELV